LNLKLAEHFKLCQGDRSWVSNTSMGFDKVLAHLLESKHRGWI
jgi:hypothetical protein